MAGVEVAESEGCCHSEAPEPPESSDCAFCDGLRVTDGDFVLPEMVRLDLPTPIATAPFEELASLAGGRQSVASAAVRRDHWPPPGLGDRLAILQRRLT